MRNIVNRRNRGASFIVLVIACAFFILLPLGLLGFEIGRVSIASQQLRGCLDAAALSGVATLASSNSVDASSTVELTYQMVYDNAVASFRQNSILGDSMASATATSSSTLPAMPVAHRGLLQVQLLTKTKTPVPLNSTTPTARSVRARGWYGYEPSLLKYVGFKTIMVSALSDGQVPSLDIVTCFDVSGSMDDDTYTSWFIKYWDPSKNPAGMVYREISREDIAEYALHAPPNGTPVNICPPQNLGQASSSTNLTPKGFTEAGPSAIGTAPYLGTRSGSAGTTEVGQPSGTLDLANGPSYMSASVRPDVTSDAYFTDIQPYYCRGWTDPVLDTITYGSETVSWPVVPSAAWAGSDRDYRFDPAFIIEASRGNLDSAANMRTALGDTGGASNPNPNDIYYVYNTFYNRGTAALQGPFSFKAGHPKYNGYVEGKPWKAIYQKYAYKAIYPMNVAIKCSKDFLTLMNNNTDSNFGFVAFSDNVGTAPDSLSSNPSEQWAVDERYQRGGPAKPYLPYIQLDPSDDKFAAVNELLSNEDPAGGRPILVPQAGTNIYDAIQAAIRQLRDHNRAQSKRVIILLTDGMPTTGGALGGDPKAATLQAARDAAAVGIKIFCIGLYQNDIVKEDQKNLLGDGQNGTNANGVAGLTKGQFYQVQAGNTDALNRAFQGISRSLVQLINPSDVSTAP